MQLNSSEVYDKIVSLYESSGMTASRLAEKSGVPLTSINRFFSGETKSPNFYSLCQVILALGGSVDDVLGVQTEHHIEVSHESKYVAQLRQDLNYERRRRHFWILAFMGMVVFIMALLVFDLLNPTFGFIRYTK